MKVFRKLEEH